MLLSHTKGLPLALLEALSYGAPVLVSDIPAAILEVIDHPAHIFRVGNIDDLWESKMTALAGMRLETADRRRRGTEAK